MPNDNTKKKGGVGVGTIAPPATPGASSSPSPLPPNDTSSTSTSSTSSSAASDINVFLFIPTSLDMPALSSTKFGAVLDMVTDRSTTACLLVYLAIMFPTWAIFFQSLIALDSPPTTCKSLSLDSNPLLRLYYTDRFVLFLVCALDQLFYICVYLLGGEALMRKWLGRLLNVIQLVGASITLARVDRNARIKGKDKVL
ncbi:hypothetical protein BC829DRAFT_400565 [Chytridium lagenaria]|nr:hypothetical protein BC829DRAFT_400565 [Chytridium lagenaria]